MRKMPVSWHKECLGNARASLAAKKAQIARDVAECEKFERDLIVYDGQIIRAEETGVTEFDRDRFGLKRAAST